MNPIIEAFRRVIPTRHRVSGRGWTTFNCPACGDRKGRGAFRETSNGGFRYNCKNGGCEYESNTGWEPGHGFFGRPQRLLEQLGGAVSDIPLVYLLTQRGISYSDAPSKVDYTDVPRFDRTEWNSYADWLMDDGTAARIYHNNTAKSFPEIELPAGSELLFRGDANKDKEDCRRYVLSRSVIFADCVFLWTPLYPRYVIYPFEYRKKLVGWIGRAIDPDNPFKHKKCANFPTDYMLNQDRAYDKPVVYVQEGVFDAVALNSLCTFGNTISRKQINYLNQVKDAGRQIILLPDHQGQEWMSYLNAAKENGWYLSVPTYPGSGLGSEGHIKDASESIKRNGLLLTAQAIVDGITDNYVEAQVHLQFKSRG